MITEETVLIRVLHAECGRCGHKWDLKRGVVPKNCPACHSPYWNAERKHKIHESRRTGGDEARAERTGAARAAIDAARLAGRGNPA